MADGPNPFKYGVLYPLPTAVNWRPVSSDWKSLCRANYATSAFRIGFFDKKSAKAKRLF